MARRAGMVARQTPRWLLVLLTLVLLAAAWWLLRDRGSGDRPDGARLAAGRGCEPYQPEEAVHMSVAKVVELVGQSDQNWFDAVERAVSEAAETIEHISGVEVYNLTANVKDGRITEWKANVKLAFSVDPAKRGTTQRADGRVQATV